MYRFYLIFLDMIPSVFYLIPLFLVLFRKELPKRKWLIILFSAYLAAVFSVVGIPYLSAFLQQPISWEPSLNLIPLLDMTKNTGGFLKNFSLNILLFVPLGFFLPILWRDKICTLKQAACYGFTFSCFIEIMQLFTFRMTDADDLIANTLGSMLGFLVYRQIFTKRLHREECFAPLPTAEITNTAALTASATAQKEITIIFLMTLVVYMTLQPITSRFIWELLL